MKNVQETLGAGRKGDYVTTTFKIVDEEVALNLITNMHDISRGSDQGIEVQRWANFDSDMAHQKLLELIEEEHSRHTLRMSVLTNTSTIDLRAVLRGDYDE